MFSKHAYEHILVVAEHGDLVDGFKSIGGVEGVDDNEFHIARNICPLLAKTAGSLTYSSTSLGESEKVEELFHFTPRSSK